MKRAKMKNNIKVVIVSFGIFILFSGHFLEPPRLFSRQSPDTSTSSESKPYRFQIELYGGYSLINPSDLNLLPDYDNHMQSFFYDDLYNYLQDDGQIRTWSKSGGTGHKKLKNALPFGFKFKYYLNNSIAISVGFKYLTKNSSQESSMEYSQTNTYGEQVTEKTGYAPYSLSVRGYTPMLGIHLSQKIAYDIELEGYIAGGPLFAECRYETNWTKEWWFTWSGGTFMTYESQGLLEEKGRGTGIALDLCGRLNIDLPSNFGLFLEGGYAYQTVKSLSGTGIETNGDITTTWEGDWGIKEENIRTFWGEINLQFPTNYWGEDEETMVGKAGLDLSGFQLRVGLFFRF
jgi:hypothetical protein